MRRLNSFQPPAYQFMRRRERVVLAFDLPTGIDEFYMERDATPEAIAWEEHRGCDFCDPSIETFDEWLRMQEAYPPPPLTVHLAEACRVS